MQLWYHSVSKQDTLIDEQEEELQRQKNRKMVNELVRQEIKERIDSMNDPEEIGRMQMCRLRTKTYMQEIIERKPQKAEAAAKHRERRSSILQVIPQVKQNIVAQHQQRKSQVLQESILTQIVKEKQGMLRELEKEESNFQNQLNTINEVMHQLENPEFQKEHVRRASVFQPKQVNQQQMRQQLEQFFGQAQRQIQNKRPIKEETQITHLSLQRPRGPIKKGRQPQKFNEVQEGKSNQDLIPLQQALSKSKEKSQERLSNIKIDKLQEKQFVKAQSSSEENLCPLQQNLKRLSNLEEQIEKRIQNRREKRQESRKLQGGLKQDKEDVQKENSISPKDISIGTKEQENKIKTNQQEILETKLQAKSQQPIIKKEKTFNHKSLIIFENDGEQENDKGNDFDMRSFELFNRSKNKSNIPARRRLYKRFEHIKRQNQQKERKFNQFQAPQNQKDQEVEKNPQLLNKQTIQKLLKQIEERIKNMKSEESSLFLNKEFENSIIEIFQCQLSPIQQFSIQEPSIEETAETQTSSLTKSKKKQNKLKNEVDQKDKKDIVNTKQNPSAKIQEVSPHLDMVQSQKSKSNFKKFTFPEIEDLNDKYQKKYNKNAKSQEKLNLPQKQNQFQTQTTSKSPKKGQIIRKKKEECDQIQLNPQNLKERNDDKNKIQKSKQFSEQKQQKEAKGKEIKLVSQISNKKNLKGKQQDDGSKNHKMEQIQSIDMLLSPTSKDNRQKQGKNDLNNSSSMHELYQQEDQKDKQNKAVISKDKCQQQSNQQEISPKFQEDSDQSIEQEEDQQPISKNTKTAVLTKTKSTPKAKLNYQQKKKQPNDQREKRNIQAQDQVIKTPQIRQSRTPQHKRQESISGSITPRIYKADKSEKDLKIIKEIDIIVQQQDTQETVDQSPKRVKPIYNQNANRLGSVINIITSNPKITKSTTTLNSQNKQELKLLQRQQIETQLQLKTPTKCTISHPQTARSNLRDVSPLSKRSPRQITPNRKIQGQPQESNLKKLLRDLKKIKTAKVDTLNYLDRLKENKTQVIQLKDDLGSCEADDLLQAIYQLTKNPGIKKEQKGKQNQKSKQEIEFNTDFLSNPKAKLQEISK